MDYLTLALSIALALAVTGCEPKSDTAPDGGAAKSGSSGSVQPAAADHAHHGHDHAAGEPMKSGAGHGGEIIELGTATIGAFTVRASRDVGEIKAGGDAPIDVWVTTADGKPATVAAVRFWIGTADAKGAMKAKASVEDPNEPSRWHTHVEVGDPVADDAGLWVEVETADGAKHVGSFDLKR